MSDYKVTPRTKLNRLPKKGVYDKALINDMIDEAYVCYLGVNGENAPQVHATNHWRQGDELFVHGSTKNSLFQSLIAGQEACINITHLDGLVFARSAMHHSANFRSVMIFGKARLVTDEAEKFEAFKHFINKVSPGRWDDVRPPNAKEMKVTMVLAFKLDEVSAKTRTGGPNDDEEDYALPVWAGIVPLETVKSSPIDDKRLIPGTPCNLSIVE